MKTAFLYCTTTVSGRKSPDRFVKNVLVPDEVFASLEKNERVSWCADNGYANDATHYYHLRDRKVIEPTAGEIAAIHANMVKLKRAGKLPSAFDAISTKLTTR
jgi:hypothetical protein